MEHHIKHLPSVIETALEESGNQMNELKAIAVTMGPG
jgi:tRNA A37 threonylcarbamoyltransferase TsaD